MHVDIPYSKEQVEAAFTNVLVLAKASAQQLKVDGQISADDILAQKSITIVEFIKDMIEISPDDTTSISK